MGRQRRVYTDEETGRLYHLVKLKNGKFRRRYIKNKDGISQKNVQKVNINFYDSATGKRIKEKVKQPKVLYTKQISKEMVKDVNPVGLPLYRFNPKFNYEIGHHDSNRYNNELTNLRIEEKEAEHKEDIKKTEKDKDDEIKKIKEKNEEKTKEYREKLAVINKKLDEAIKIVDEKTRDIEKAKLENERAKYLRVLDELRSNTEVKRVTAERNAEIAQQKKDYDLMKKAFMKQIKREADENEGMIKEEANQRAVEKHINEERMNAEKKAKEKDEDEKKAKKKRKDDERKAKDALDKAEKKREKEKVDKEKKREKEVSERERKEMAREDKRDPDEDIPLIELVRENADVDVLHPFLPEHIIEVPRRKLKKQIGEGIQDGLYNDEIAKIARHRIKNQVVPVIAQDQIDDLPKYLKKGQKIFAGIINTNPSTSDGSGNDGHRVGHWTSFVVDARDDFPSIEWFDPLVQDKPSRHLLETLKGIGQKMNPERLFLFKNNQIQRQAKTSNGCGIHSLKFVEDRVKGVPWSKATGYDSFIMKPKIGDDSKKGEAEIQAIAKKYSKYI